MHDIAPGATLAFHAVGGSPEEFVDAIEALVDAGCDVIVDDICTSP